MPLTIAVYSDVVCPWCHLGKKRLEEGLRRAGLQDEAQIVFLPYELNPDMPEEGIDRDAYLAAKFGREKLGEMFGRLDAAGEADGVRFDWAAMKRMPNTRKAHVLIALANGLDMGPKVKGELMAAFFEQGRDIGDEEVLIGIGAAAGLSRPEMAAAFRDAELGRRIGEIEDHAQRIGVQGVPFFIVENRFAVSGAQPPEVWAEALPGIIAELARGEAG